MGNPANELCEKAGAPPKEGGGGWDHGKPVLGSGSAGGAGLQGKYLRSGMGPEIFEIEMHFLSDFHPVFGLMRTLVFVFFFGSDSWTIVYFHTSIIE